jgi:hypothetical protein
MTAAPSDLGATPHPRSHRWVWLVVAGATALVAAVVVVTGVDVLVFHGAEGRSVPKFVSLAEHPDASLQGTVAYTAADRCIRIVAAAGQTVQGRAVPRATAAGPGEGGRRGQGDGRPAAGVVTRRPS